MATREQLIQGIKDAHAANDPESAEKLYGKVKAMDEAPAPEASQDYGDEEANEWSLANLGTALYDGAKESLKATPLGQAIGGAEKLANVAGDMPDTLAAHSRGEGNAFATTANTIGLEIVNDAAALVSNADLLLPQDRDFDGVKDETPLSERVVMMYGAAREQSQESAQAQAKWEEENTEEAIPAMLLGLSIQAVATAGLGVASQTANLTKIAQANMASKAALAAKSKVIAKSTGAIAAGEGAIVGVGTVDKLDPNLASTQDVVLNIAKYTALGGGAGYGLGRAVPYAPLALQKVADKYDAFTRLASGKYQRDYVQHHVNDSVKNVRYENPELSDKDLVDKVMETANPHNLDRGTIMDALESSMLEVPRYNKAEGELVTDYQRKLAATLTAEPVPFMSRFRGKKKVVEAPDARGFVVGMDEAFMPVATRLQNIDPVFHGRAVGAEADEAIMIADTMPRLKALEKLELPANDEVNTQVSRLMVDGDYEGIVATLNKNGLSDVADSFKALDEIQDTLDDLLRESGVKIPKRGPQPGSKRHYSRKVVNVTDLRNHLGVEDDLAEQYLNKVEAQMRTREKTQRALSEGEIGEAMAEFLDPRNQAGRKLTDAGATKARTVDYDNTLKEFYHSPAKSIFKDVKEKIANIHERKVFNIKDGDEFLQGIGTRVNLDGAIERMLSETRGMANTPQMDEMRNILKGLYGAGKESSPQYINNIKNFGTMSLLANPKAALIQLADASSAIVEEGLGNTVRAYSSTIHNSVATMIDANKGALRGTKVALNTRAINLEDIITLDISAKGTGVIEGTTSKGLKLSGFHGVDQFGKNVLIRAAVNKGAAMAKSPKGRAQLLEKWKYLMGEEEALQYIKELGEGAAEMMANPSGLAKKAAWLSVHNIQPISRTKYAQGYHNNPKLRSIYAMKSFALSQADLLRRGVYNNLKKGNYKDGLSYLARYAIATTPLNYGLNEVRQWAWTLGEDKIDIPDVDDVPTEVAVQMLSTMAFLDEYGLQSALQDGNFSGLAATAVMPMGMVASVPIDTANLIMTYLDDEDFDWSDTETMQQLPWGLGHYLNMAFGDGQLDAKEKYERKLVRENPRQKTPAEKRREKRQEDKAGTTRARMKALNDSRRRRSRQR
jgi:hypothetical protein